MYKYIVFIILLGVLVAGISYETLKITGNPISQQAIASDNSKLLDFSLIQSAVEHYYQDKKKLPDNLSVVKDQLTLKDPKVLQDYKYEIASDSAYKLCAEFSTDSTKTQNDSSVYYLAPLKTHKKGFDCITYDLPVYLLPSPTSQPIPTSIPANCRNFDGNLDACDSHGIASLVGGGNCAYYLCSNQCWPKGTPNSVACPK